MLKGTNQKLCTSASAPRDHGRSHKLELSPWSYNRTIASPGQDSVFLSKSCPSSYPKVVLWATWENGYCPVAAGINDVVAYSKRR